MNIKRLTVAAFSACALGLVSLSTAIPAQAAQGSRQIEEVIVTATRREASVQDVPIAVSAFSGEDLEARGVQDLYGLQQVSPSIAVYNSNSTGNGGTVRIRGIGTTGNNPGLESAVGTFVDGIYRSRSGIAFNDFVDVERVEVLRGPQGTLFGKNTSAGALNIITKKPEFETGGHLEVGAGDLETFKTNGSITGPITDTLAYRLAGTYHQRDEGNYQDFATGDWYDTRDRWMVKGQLLWEPSDDFDARLIVDYTKKKEDCCPSAWKEVSAGSTASYLFANPDAFLTTDTRKMGINYAPFEDTTDKGVSLEINYDIDALEATLTSVTGYRDYQTDRTQDWDFTNVDIAAFPGQDIGESFENWSQELRLQGTAGNIDWLVGGYIYNEQLDTDERLALGTDSNRYVAHLFTGGAPGAVFDSLINADFLNNGYSADWSTETSGYALFTHNVINFTPQFNMTVGLRYTSENKDGKGVLNGVAPLPNNADPQDIFDATAAGNEAQCDNAIFRTFVGSFCDNASYKRNRGDDAWTGTFALGYAFTDSQNVYVSYSRGFKAGGLNNDQEALDTTGMFTGAATAPVDGVEFENETVDAYEIGHKAQYLDGALTVNTALFYTKFEDFQLNTFTGLGFVVGNPGDVESKGIEIESSWAANDWLYLTAGYTYADARYDDNLAPGNESIEGRILTQSPYNQASASVSVEQGLGIWDLRGFGTASWSWRDSVNTGSGLELDKIQGGITMWNLQAGVTTADNRWEFKVYCNNCADEEYDRVIYNQVFASSSRATFLNDQRVWGGSIRANF